MTKRRHAREVLPGDPIRDVAMGITSAGVRDLVQSAAAGDCRLWTTKTRHSSGLMGQTIYQICPESVGFDVFIEFKIAPDQELWVFSVHEDSEKGQFR